MTTPELVPAPAPIPGGAAPSPETPAPKPLTHGCARCGAQIPIDVGLCERCNPLGLRDSSASQVHGTVFIAVLVGIIGLALLAKLTLTGVGPFSATVTDAVPQGANLVVTLAVTNDGKATGQTTCRVTDPQDRNGGKGAIVLSPPIDAGATATFSQIVTEFGAIARPLTVECSSP